MVFDVPRAKFPKRAREGCSLATILRYYYAIHKNIVKPLSDHNLLWSLTKDLNICNFILKRRWAGLACTKLLQLSPPLYNCETQNAQDQAAYRRSCSDPNGSFETGYLLHPLGTHLFSSNVHMFCPPARRNW